MKPFAKMASAIKTIAPNNFIITPSHFSQSKSGNDHSYFSPFFERLSFNLPVHTHSLSVANYV